MQDEMIEGLAYVSGMDSESECRLITTALIGLRDSGEASLWFDLLVVGTTAGPSKTVITLQVRGATRRDLDLMRMYVHGWRTARRLSAMSEAAIK